jgi:hypothetical protein
MNDMLVKRYWVDSPTTFEKRLSEIINLHPDDIEDFELCKTNLGQKVPGIRMGRGSKNIFLLGREHGHEPVGTCGLTALIEGLAEGKIPEVNKKFNRANEILNKFTLHIFPLMNPDGAERFSRQIKNSFPADQFRYCQEDSDKYKFIHSEPGITLKNNRPSHFSDEEMKIWRKTGKPIGSLFTEDGVELWIDWKYEKAPQTKAIKKIISKYEPSLFVDIHAHEIPTLIAAPAELNNKDTAKHTRLTKLLYKALTREALPSIQDKKLYRWEDPNVNTSIGWIYKTFQGSSLQYLYEIDNGYRWYNPSHPEIKIPTISKTQIILSVWYGIITLLEGILTL